MRSIMKPVALIKGADKNVEPEFSRQDEKVEHSIQGIVRRLGKTEISATVEAVILARRQPVFDFVTAEDVLPKVLTGYGLLPAVLCTSGNNGPWDRPGSAQRCISQMAPQPVKKSPLMSVPDTSPIGQATIPSRCATLRNLPKVDGGLKTMRMELECDVPTRFTAKAG